MSNVNISFDQRGNRAGSLNGRNTGYNLSTITRSRSAPVRNQPISSRHHFRDSTVSEVILIRTAASRSPSRICCLTSPSVLSDRSSSQTDGSHGRDERRKFVELGVQCVHGSFLIVGASVANERIVFEEPVWFPHSHTPTSNRAKPSLPRSEPPKFPAGFHYVVGIIRSRRGRRNSEG
jgi:hypothetical protein